MEVSRSFVALMSPWLLVRIIYMQVSNSRPVLGSTSDTYFLKQRGHDAHGCLCKVDQASVGHASAGAKDRKCNGQAKDEGEPSRARGPGCFLDARRGRPH